MLLQELLLNIIVVVLFTY